MADSEWKFDEDESEDGKVYFVLLNDPAMPRLLSKIWVFQQKFYQLTNLPAAATSYNKYNTVQNVKNQRFGPIHTCREDYLPFKGQFFRFSENPAQPDKMLPSAAQEVVSSAPSFSSSCAAHQLPAQASQGSAHQLPAQGVALHKLDCLFLIGQKISIFKAESMGCLYMIKSMWKVSTPRT